MEKKLISKEIINRISDRPFIWKDIKNLLLENEDKIDIDYDEGSGSYELTIYRQFLETDEEFEKRKQKLAEYCEFNRKQRFETYKKLRKEFDGEIPKIV